MTHHFIPQKANGPTVKWFAAVSLKLSHPMTKRRKWISRQDPFTLGRFTDRASTLNAQQLNRPHANPRPTATFFIFFNDEAAAAARKKALKTRDRIEANRS
jgi:hypothetical protein